MKPASTLCLTFKNLLYVFVKMKGEDQPVNMHSLFCIFVICCKHNNNTLTSENPYQTCLGCINMNP